MDARVALNCRERVVVGIRAFLDWGDVAVIFIIAD